MMLLIGTWSVGGCASCRIPIPNPIMINIPNENPTPKLPAIFEQSIDDLASRSKCSEFRFDHYDGEKIVPPKNYLKGLLYSYAQAACKNDPIINDILSLPAKSADSFASYKIDSNLANAYALVLGLGLWESSGHAWEGIDVSCKRPNKITSDTAEAGAWQTSWDSNSVSGSKLNAFFNSWKGFCFTKEYYEGVNTSSLNVVNNGPESEIGFMFQEKSKACPAFASEYTALVVKLSGQEHYWPLKQHKAQFIPACKNMFESVQKLIQADPEICKSFSSVNSR